MARMTISTNARIISLGHNAVLRALPGRRPAQVCCLLVGTDSQQSSGSVVENAVHDPAAQDFHRNRERRTGARRLSISPVRNMPVASSDSFSMTEGMS
jgi:hypothetical protein